MEEVPDRGTFAQELRVRGNVERRACLIVPLDGRAHPFAGLNRHGRLLDNQMVVADAGSDVAGDVLDVGQVRLAVLSRRSADRDKAHLALGNRRPDISGEPQTTGSLCLSDNLGEPRLKDGHFAAVERVNPGRVVVDADDVVAYLCETRAGREPHIAGTDDGNFHSGTIAGERVQSSKRGRPQNRCRHNHRGHREHRVGEAGSPARTLSCLCALCGSMSGFFGGGEGRERDQGTKE